MELELRHLRLVVAVADAGSIGAAARALGIDQPLVSRQLRRIEGELGTVLFHRAAGGVTLTPAGADFVARARPLLHDARGAPGAHPGGDVDRAVRRRRPGHPRR